MSARGPYRARAALRGAPLEPPVTGLTFIGPTVLSAAGRSAAVADILSLSVEKAGADFAFVPGSAPWAKEAVALLHERGAAAFWVVGGVLWPSLDPNDPIVGLMLAATEPELLAPALDAAAAASVGMVAQAVAAGADAIVVADDLAGDEGLLVPPDFVLDELIPRYEKVVAATAAEAMSCVFHSDGDVRSVLPALAAAGFVALHSGGLRDEAFDRTVAAARRVDMAVIGGLSTVTLDKGLPAAVSAGARVGVLASGGGLLVADDGGVTTHQQYAALVAALESARGRGEADLPGLSGDEKP